MPRGVRKILDFNEELKKIDGQIDELKAKRSALLEKKREHDLGTLYDFLDKNGISTEDALEILTTAVAAAAQKPQPAAEV